MGGRAFYIDPSSPFAQEKRGTGSLQANVVAALLEDQARLGPSRGGHATAKLFVLKAPENGARLPVLPELGVLSSAVNDKTDDRVTREPRSTSSASWGDAIYSSDMQSDHASSSGGGELHMKQLVVAGQVRWPSFPCPCIACVAGSEGGQSLLSSWAVLGRLPTSVLSRLLAVRCAGVGRGGKIQVDGDPRVSKVEGAVRIRRVEQPGRQAAGSVETMLVTERPLGLDGAQRKLVVAGTGTALDGMYKTKTCSDPACTYHLKAPWVERRGLGSSSSTAAAVISRCFPTDHTRTVLTFRLGTVAFCKAAGGSRQPASAEDMAAIAQALKALGPQQVQAPAAGGAGAGPTAGPAGAAAAAVAADPPPAPAQEQHAGGGSSGARAAGPPAAAMSVEPVAPAPLGVSLMGTDVSVCLAPHTSEYSWASQIISGVMHSAGTCGACTGCPAQPFCPGNVALGADRGCTCGWR